MTIRRRSELVVFLAPDSHFYVLYRKNTGKWNSQVTQAV